MKTPDELKYQETDEWVMIEGKQATMGISDYAQSQLSDIVFVEFDFEADDEIKAGDIIATIESVKAAGDVISPVSGKIIEVNEKLTEEPETLNKDPYGEGWIAKIKPSNLEKELKELMNRERYIEFIKEDLKKRGL